MSFNVKGFDGAVKLKHYSMMPDGKNYIAVCGKVSILGDSEVIDFEVKGSETANWIARVEGQSGSVNILGCQIEMVHQFGQGVPEVLDSTYYRVP